MAYVKHFSDWKDATAATGGGDESTPIDQAALDHIETGIFDAAADADTAQDTIDDHIADPAGAHPATAVSVTPTGNLAADDAQEAFNEHQGDIDTLTSGLAAIGFQVVFPALSVEPPAASYATLDTRNSHPVLDFDAAADESAVFRGVLPASYGGGGLNVKLIWAATSATSGNVIWDVAFERIPVGALDIDADSFAASVTASAAADATSGETTETTLAFSDGAAMDSLAAGEMFRLKVTRDANNVSDNAAGDAELLAVVVTEQ